MPPCEPVRVRARQTNAEEMVEGYGVLSVLVALGVCCVSGKTF